MESALQILVVEDDRVIAEALRERLRQDGHEPQLCGDGVAAVEAFRLRRHDLVLLDIMLPGMNGLEVCQAMREISLQVPIIMLTARDAVEDRILGLNSGADDYVTKPFSLDELMARVAALWRRSRPKRGVLLRFLHLSLDPEAVELRAGHHREALTTREYAVMEFLMLHPDRVLSRAEIYEGAWDQPYRGRSNMVDVYINYLRNKTEAEGGPKVIHTVRGRGYVLRAPD
jgi:two-component system, OmpR family, response regulator MprA